MSLDVSTKDCSQLTDSELAEMADLCVETSHYEIGDLNKQAEAWVLVRRESLSRYEQLANETGLRPWSAI